MQLWARSIVRIVRGPPEPMTRVRIPASPSFVKFYDTHDYYYCDV